MTYQKAKSLRVDLTYKSSRYNRQMDSSILKPYLAAAKYEVLRSFTFDNEVEESTIEFQRLSFAARLLDKLVSLSDKIVEVCDRICEHYFG